MNNIALADHQTHKNSGRILITIASTVLVFGFFLTFTIFYSWAIILSVAAYLLSNSGFKHLEKAAEFIPPSAHQYETGRLSATLKSGSEIEVYLDVLYPNDENTPYTLPRLNATLQRILGSYCSQIQSLSPNPFPEIDALFMEQNAALCQELGLSRISVRTIDIKQPKSQPSNPPGIHLRGLGNE